MASLAAFTPATTGSSVSSYSVLKVTLKAPIIKGGYRLANTNGTDYRLRDQASIRGRAGCCLQQLAALRDRWCGIRGHRTHQRLREHPASKASPRTRTGWTVGAGWEYGFTPNWSARLEYRYTDFGSYRDRSTFSFPGFTYEDHPRVSHGTCRYQLSLRRPGRRQVLQVLIWLPDSPQQLKAPASSGAFCAFCSQVGPLHPHRPLGSDRRLHMLGPHARGQQTAP